MQLNSQMRYIWRRSVSFLVTNSAEVAFNLILVAFNLILVSLLPFPAFPLVTLSRDHHMIYHMYSLIQLNSQMCYIWRRSASFLVTNSAEVAFNLILVAFAQGSF